MQEEKVAEVTEDVTPGIRGPDARAAFRLAAKAGVMHAEGEAVEVVVVMAVLLLLLLLLVTTVPVVALGKASPPLLDWAGLGGALLPVEPLSTDSVITALDWD